MPLVSGTKLGPYEIQTPLGAGGMGEVYRARDTRLERAVAIKILPEQLSKDPIRKQRFEREAKTISGLNHPNICTLHDVGSQDGVDYLVMECVEGETLAKRLEKGPLPLEQVLKYGAQIADALDKAHRAGIVHRDLKPGNIMLTPTGAKLLDFGLAKPAALASGMTLTAAMPTTPVTQEGMVVGTFQYMSPEQVEGKELDGRSDIFSLGAVLYEMLTGKKAFEGKSQLSVASAILEKEPAPIIDAKPLTPPALDHVIRRCLAKELERRWQTAADLKCELEWIVEQGAKSGSEPVGSSSRRRSAVLCATAAFLAAAILGGMVWRERAKPPSSATAVRFMVSLPPASAHAMESGPVLALSPDAQRMVYVAGREGTTQLYARDLDAFEGKYLAGTEGASAPFFSPDGAWIGFYADGKLKKIPTIGGPAAVLCEAPEGNGATWLEDGTIVFNANWNEGLRQVHDSGGKSEVVTRPDAGRGEAFHWWPEAVPGGKAVLFTVQAGPGRSEASVAALSLHSGEWKTVLRKGSNPHYMAAAKTLVYVNEGSLWAAPFDTEKLEVTGPSLPALQGFAINPYFSAAQFAVSRNGSLAYIPGVSNEMQNTLVKVDRAGHEEPLTGERHGYEDLTLSPDGRYLALTMMGDNYSIWMYELQGGNLRRLTFEGDNRDPIWTADGKRVIYGSFQNGHFAVHWKAISGREPEEQLVSLGAEPWPTSCAKDGKQCTLDVLSESAAGVMLLPLAGERKLASAFNDPLAEGAAISPDGKWVAYESAESGRSEIYVRQFPAGAVKWLVSTDGGIRVKWSSNGRELFYRKGTGIRSENTLMSVGVETEPVFKVGGPKPLFRFKYQQSGHDYAVMPDGEHFLCIKENDVGPGQAAVVLQWDAELKKK